MAMDGAARSRPVTRRKFLGTVAAAGIGAAASRWLPGMPPGESLVVAAPPHRGGTLRIAEIGEPLTLDTMATTADLTVTITLPIFETLFAFDTNWRVQPSLVSSYTVSKDGLTYTFTLRKDVSFHNGSGLTAGDVVASLNRWGKLNPRGAPVYKALDSVSANGSDTVTMKMKSPFAPLLSFLALPGSAVIMPKEIADAAGTAPLKQFVGTGPYKFAEWAPDRYVHVVRFDQYAARSEPASGYAGRKDALADDVYYYPVSQVATRIAGVQSGDYQIADGINQDAYAQLKKDPRLEVGIVQPGSYLVFVFNTKQGIMTNLKLRQAVLVALDMQPIMQATFGDSDLYSLDPSLYPKGTPWYTTAGAEWYNVHSVDRAMQLAKEAGYSGQVIRWLSTQQYDYMFKSTVIAASQLQHAGFKVDLQVLEWAGVLDHRAKPADWDVFVTSGGFLPDPSLQNIYSGAWPGWWDVPDKNRLFAEFNAEPDQAKRAQLWTKLHQLWYTEAPVVRPGVFYQLVLSRKGLPGFRPASWIIPWNVEAVK
jgi:peptide/nickel transport system substrate-binding protein